jgi:hypothetical protein
MGVLLLQCVGAKLIGKVRCPTAAAHGVLRLGIL